MWYQELALLAIIFVVIALSWKIRMIVVNMIEKPFRDFDDLFIGDLILISHNKTLIPERIAYIDKDNGYGFIKRQHTPHEIIEFEFNQIIEKL